MKARQSRSKLPHHRIRLREAIEFHLVRFFEFLWWEGETGNPRYIKGVLLVHTMPKPSDRPATAVDDLLC